MFFETDQAFSIGASIRLTVLLELKSTGNSICLHCRGQIMRAERQQEKMWFAVAFTSYWFEPLGGGEMEGERVRSRSFRSMV
jgi:hypothetical protein